MKNLKNVICALLSAGFILCAASCGLSRGKTKYTDISYEYFDTSTQIIGYADSREEFDVVCAAIKALLSEYHKLYDIYFSYEGVSNIKTINAISDGSHREVKVDKKIIDLLKFSKEMYVKTSGYTNIAMGAVLSIWHEHREYGIANPEDASLPEMSVLRAAAEHTDIDNIVINEEESTVFLSDAEMTLDVGATAKGYTVERVAGELISKGISGYLLNVGGNIRAIGYRGDGSEWQIGIENPDTESDEKYVKVFDAHDISVVTSGAYRRFYTVDGVRYNHIINKDTLMPGDGFLSVSVICEDSGLGDALSTALFCMNYESGLALVKSIDVSSALWVLESGERYYYGGE